MSDDATPYAADPVAVLAGELLRPTRWHHLPAHTAEAVAEAALSVAASPAGKLLFEQLIVTYLLAHPPQGTTALARFVGKQDVIRELLDIVQCGLELRRNHGRRHDSDGANDAPEW